MSAVIKSGASGRGLQVREFGFEPPPGPASAEQRRIAELEHRLEAALSEAEDLRRRQARADDAIAQARREGHAGGLIEGGRIAADRLAALEETVAQALAEAAAAFAGSLERLEAASGELAAIALERIVGDAGSRRTLILETVGRAVGRLSTEAVVALDVSGADFEDGARLSQAVPDGCAVRVLADLPSGACRLRLRMGEIDLDLDGQLARLRAVLVPDGGPVS